MFKQVTVVVETDRGEILRDAPQPPLPDLSILETEGIDGRRIERIKFEVLGGTFDPDPLVKRKQQTGIRIGSQSFSADIEDVGRCPGRHHGLEFRVETSGIPGIQTSDPDTRIGLLESFQGSFDDRILGWTSIARPMHDDEFRIRTGTGEPRCLPDTDPRKGPDHQQNGDHQQAASSQSSQSLRQRTFDLTGWIRHLLLNRIG